MKSLGHANLTVRHSVLVRVTIAVMKYHDQRQLGEGRVYSIHSSTAQFIINSNEGRNIFFYGFVETFSYAIGMVFFSADAWKLCLFMVFQSSSTSCSHWPSLNDPVPLALSELILIPTIREGFHLSFCLAHWVFAFFISADSFSIILSSFWILFPYPVLISHFTQYLLVFLKYICLLWVVWA